MNGVFLERDRVDNSQTNTFYKHGAHFKPHLEATDVSDASSNTLEENGKLSCAYLPVLTFNFTVLEVLSNACTCPFIGDMSIYPDMDILGQGYLYLPEN